MTVFLAVAVLVIEIIGQLTDHAAEIFSALLTGLNWLLGVAKPIIFGFVMAYILKPLNEFFTERYSRLRFLKKYSRVLGVVTTLLLVLIIITGIVSAIVYSVTNQLQVANLDQLFGAISAITKNVTDFYAQMMEKLQELDIQSEQIVNYVEGLSSSIMGFVQSLANGVIGSVSNISGYITTIMFGLVIGIYFMIDGNSMMSYFSGVADAVLPDRTNAKIRSVLADLNEVFSGYIRGQLLDVTFMIFATGTAMLITGISLAPIIGLMTGLANLVPYLGPFVGYSSIIIISVVEGKYDVMIASLIALLVIQTLDGNIIEAKLLGKSIRIHPLLVVIFLIFGSAIGGLWGMLLAVPVGAYFQKLFTAFVERRKNAKILERATRDSVVREKDESADYVEANVKDSGIDNGRKSAGKTEGRKGRRQSDGRKG